MKYAIEATICALGALCLAMPGWAEPLLRPLPAAGSVIARKSGEEVRFVDISGWRYVDLQQDLLSGDVLRTNATGQLAVLFSDRTQVRLGRNTSLLVKKMGRDGDTGLELQSGTIWARAERGGQGLTIDTPAAAAAIRGTDWTMTVAADGKTSLIVLEGLIEFSNAYGSVTVAKGEGAVAAIGQAPSKIIVVNSDDRQQMLYNLSLREAFNLLPLSSLSGADIRSERRRIIAIAPPDRRAEDWLTLAEVQMVIDGRQAAAAALGEARAHRLTASQKARSDLVEAFMAGAENRFGDAAMLFKKAGAHLDAKRRSIAQYGGYYARSLHDPKLVETPPKRGEGPYGALAEAYTAAFLQDIPTAVALLKKAEGRYPDNALLPAARARIVMLLNDRDQAREAIARALALDPLQAIALETRADYRDSIDGDREGALADLKVALDSEPGNDMVWNRLGIIQSDRGANREAEAAFIKAIELDPADPLGHVNLAFLYLEELRVEDAKKQIDLAVQIDPSFEFLRVARGRYYLQTGRTDKAIEDFLAASVSNPAYSQGQLLLAAALYQDGDRTAFDQAVDNADRLDPNDPVISSLRTSIAIDDYDAESAIRNAQELLRRSRARGGEFGTLSASQDAGSVLNEAFRLQGLDAWGQYYGDVVFDPFAGTSYIDQYVHGSVNPFANAFLYGGNNTDYVQNGSSYSSFLQALLLDPHMLASSERKATLLRYPFVETSLGGGFNTSDGDTDWTQEAQIQGYSSVPRPISFFGNLQLESTPFAGTFLGGIGTYDGEMKVVGGNGYVTTTPTPDDRLVAYWNHSKNEFSLDNALAGLGSIDRDDEATATRAGLGWSHTIEYQNIVNAALFYSDERSENETSFGGAASVNDHSAQKTYVAALNHTFEEDDLTWRYGVEGGWADARFSQDIGGVALTEPTSQRYHIGRIYVDALQEINPDLKAEYALFGTYIKGGNVDVSSLEPRVGIAWAPTDGHWLRAAYMRNGYDFGAPTLSPIGIVGLQPNAYGIGIEGHADTFAVRWDAEWTDRLFTALDFQHQDLSKVSIAFPETSPLPYIPGGPIGTTLQTNEGRIDRASFTANLLLNHNLGISATIASADSEDRDPGSLTFGDSLPFVPNSSGKIALTWVNEANIKATVAANYVGKRDTGLKTILDDYWTIDGSLTWEPFDKRIALELSAFNLLNEKFELAPSVPGWGRAFKGSFKVRF